MRIGTRITLTASLLVVVTLGGFGWWSVRDQVEEKKAAVERQVRDVAATVRAALEAEIGTAPVPAEASLSEAERSWQGQKRPGVPYTVRVLDARDLPPPDAPATEDASLERVRKLVKVSTGAIYEEVTEGGRPMYVHVEPVRVRAPSPLHPDGYRTIAAVEVTHDLSGLDTGLTEETARMLGSLAVLSAIIVAAIYLSVRRSIGRPIKHLIAGIDGVAKGDLSETLMQERDDEIGALATRFNAMTQSLREAREETRRGVEQRLALEANLSATSQLATIGQIAAEIAHECGTPLNVVSGRARAMLKKADDPEAVEKNAGIIAEQAGRITRIIQRLLDVARRRVGEADRGTVDLNRLATDTLELLEHQLGNARVSPATRLQPELGPVPAARDQLQQVLINLYMNAIQAMPDGGRLEVATHAVRRRRPGLALAPEQAYAVLEVADTGVGIPEEAREKIFEAFYTSRAGAGGTGLGLAVAHGIVKDHDGWIEIDDNAAAGRGTVFRVFLPREAAESGTSTAAA